MHRRMAQAPDDAELQWWRQPVPAQLQAQPPAPPVPLGASLAEAAAFWAYDGAEVGDVCRGGDLGCAGGHCYAPTLDRALAGWAPPSRGAGARQAPPRLLELGVCAGHSLAVWQQHLAGRFGGAALLVGVDLHLDVFRAHRGQLEARGFAPRRGAATKQTAAST